MDKFDEIQKAVAGSLASGTLIEQYIKTLIVAGVPLPDIIDEQQVYQWAVETGLKDKIPPRTIDDAWEPSDEFFRNQKS